MKKALPPLPNEFNAVMKAIALAMQEKKRKASEVNGPVQTG